MARTDLINEGLLADYHDELMKTYIAGGCIFDISAYHATGTPPVLATYADLAAALGTNGANVPVPMRKGGMSIKFVCTYDNKYVQYRLTASSFSSNRYDWQKMDDNFREITEDEYRCISEQHLLKYSFAPDNPSKTIKNNLYHNKDYYVIVECSQDIENANLGFSNSSFVSESTAIVYDGILRKGKNIYKASYTDRDYFVTRPYSGISKIYFYLCEPSNISDVQNSLESVILRSGVQKSSVIYPAKQDENLPYIRLALPIVCEGKVSLRFNDASNLFSSVNILVRDENDNWEAIVTTTTGCINTWKNYTLPYKITALSFGTGTSIKASANGNVSFDVIVDGSLSERIDRLNSELGTEINGLDLRITDTETNLQLGEQTLLSPSAIQYGKVVKTTGIDDKSTFDVYTYPIDSAKDYYIHARMNKGNTFYLVFYSEDEEVQNIIGHEPWIGSSQNILYVPSKDSVKKYEKLNIPDGANYFSINVRNTEATIGYLKVLSFVKTGEFNAVENDQRITAIEQNVHTSNDIISLYSNGEHKGKVYDIGKKVVGGRGNEDTHIDLTKPQPLVLVHFSDAHASSNIERVVDYYKLYQNNINDVINTGDLVSDYFEDGIGFFTDMDGHEKILNVIGNHDTRKRNSEYEDTRMWSEHAGKDAYDTYIGPFINNWGNETNPVVQPSDAETVGKCYYYKDYTQQKIRLIVIDNMVMLTTSENYDANQITWFESVLDDALQNEMTVVGAMHFPNDGEVIVSPFCAYGQTAGSGDWASSIMIQFYNAIDSFKQSGGKFVCWLAGHKHSSVLGKAKQHNDQLIISVGSTIGDGRSSWNRSYGTKNQDFFHLVGIDSYRNIIKVLQIGVEYDARMRHRNVLCYDYVENEFITGVQNV